MAGRTTVYSLRVRNIYFDLTEAFNAEAPTVALASGQAVVFYQVAITSKDGDWIIRETPDASERVLAELERRAARLRYGAPLDPRWLSGGWSSHFEFADEVRRRVRCDFISRPPRVPAEEIERLFRPGQPKLVAIDVESLILMKRTQRAKDYPVIAELARRLPPEREIELTTDPDRIIELARRFGHASDRPVITAARRGAPRRDIVVGLAEELDAQQQDDRRRLERFEAASRRYLEEWSLAGLADRPLRDAHEQAVDLAERWLPTYVGPQ